MGGSGPGAEQLDHLGVVREAAGLVLREDEVAVGDDVEDAAAAFDQLGLDTELALQPGLQTGGLGQVVSLHAVGDGDPHRAQPSTSPRFSGPSWTLGVRLAVALEVEGPEASAATLPSRPA